MPLTKEQQLLVEQNMGLVGTVIKENVNNPNKIGIFTYDDLFQFGCIGLCTAAETYHEGGKAKFDTYAYVLIRNHIFHKLEYVTLRTLREQCYDPDELPCVAQDDFTKFAEYETLDNILDSIAATTSGVIKKGITVIRMQAEGYSCKEIGARFNGASANNVSAWISRAKKYLREDPAIAALKP